MSNFLYLFSNRFQGAFILSYIVCQCVIGFPLLFLQLALGQFTAKDALRVFSLVPLAGGLGVTMMLYSTIRILYKNIKVAWLGYYFFNSFNISFSPEFSWNPTWKDCVHTEQEMEHNERCGHVAPTNLSNLWCTLEFYHTKVLGLYSECDVNTEDFVHESSDIHWRLFGVLVFVYSLGYLISFKGIKSIGKCVEILVPISCVLMVIFTVINIATTQNDDRLANAAIHGIETFYTPKLEDLKNFEIWFYAALHSLHSLSLDTGTMIVIGSHARFQSSAHYHALYICIADLCVSLLSGTIIYGELGILAQTVGIEVPGRHGGLVADYLTSYLFYILSSINRINTVSGMFVCIYFFILVTLGTIHVSMTIFVVVKPLYEFFPVVMKWKKLSTLASFIPFLLLSLLFMNRGSRSIFTTVEAWAFPQDIVDLSETGEIPKRPRGFKLRDMFWITPFVHVPMVLIMLLMFSFIYGYGLNRLRQDIDFMLHFYPNKFFAITWCSMPFIILCLIIGKEYETRTAGVHVYKTYADEAKMTAFVSLLFVPTIGYAIWTFVLYYRRGLLATIHRPVDEKEWDVHDLQQTLQKDPRMKDLQLTSHVATTRAMATISLCNVEADDEDADEPTEMTKSFRQPLKKRQSIMVDRASLGFDVNSDEDMEEEEESSAMMARDVETLTDVASFTDEASRVSEELSTIVEESSFFSEMTLTGSTRSRQGLIPPKD